MKGEGVWKNVNGEPQQETYQNKNSSALLDRIPIQEKNIYHRVDKPHKIEFIKYQYLRQYQEQKSQCIYEIYIIGHYLSFLPNFVFQHHSHFW